MGTWEFHEFSAKDFQNVCQVSIVIHEARAFDVNTQMIFPLVETAAAIRGENELWLAMVLRNKILLYLKPAQFAAVCGSLVSEGIKVRPWKNNRYPLALVSDVGMPSCSSPKHFSRLFCANLCL